MPRQTLVLGEVEYTLRFNPVDAAYMAAEMHVDFRDLQKKLGDLSTRYKQDETQQVLPGVEIAQTANPIQILEAINLLAPFFVAMTHHKKQHRGRTADEMLEFFDDNCGWSNVGAAMTAIMATINDSMPREGDAPTVKKD